MTTTLIRYPDAWSYSNWATYDTCPFQYHGRKVLKMPEAPSAALEQGNVFHQQIAGYITAPNGIAPERPIHARIQPVVAQLRKMEDKVVEEQWGFDSQWRPTGWFTKAPEARKTWLRVVLDVGIVYPDATALVGDWKTGKRYESNDDQMEIFALASFARFTAVNEVETRLWYVDNGAEECATFQRKDAPALQAKWEARATAMLSDRTWAPRPNDKCRFCIRARQAGGDCKFG